MRKYVLTSPKFEGAVTLGYNEDGWLVFYSNEAAFESLQHQWFLSLDKNVFPRHVSEIGNLTRVIKGKLEEVPPDVSFDAFWDAYGRKINRKRVEALWKRMSEPQRLKCIISIKPYLQYLARVKWRTQADPDTYLRNESYETEWNKQMQ